MQVTKQTLEKSQIELRVELSIDEFKPYIEQGVQKISRDVKIDGFRPGKIPYNILKQKIGEITILEEAARIAINKTLEQVIKENADSESASQPQVSITKLAPDNPLEYKVIIAILPKIQLGDYKNAKVKIEKNKINPDEVLKTLEQLREAYAKEVIVDREIKESDKAIVDINISVDNVPIEDGQGKNTAIIIGKNYVVPGFDKNLIGAKKGEEREFNLPYPEDHHMANLAGKIANIKVTVKETYERKLPELDDNFASAFGLKKFEELKTNIHKSLEAEKKQKAEQKAEIEMLDKIINKTKFGDIPESLVSQEGQVMMAELERNIASQGGKFDDYLSSIKKTRDQLILDLLPDAVKRVKSALLIREVAEAEKIKISDKEVEKKIEELLKQYNGHKKVEARIKEPGYKAYLRNILVNRKVIEKLKEWNVE